MKKHILNILILIILIFVILDLPLLVYIPVFVLASITPIKKYFNAKKAKKAVNFYCITPKPFKELSTEIAVPFVLFSILSLLIHLYYQDVWTNFPFSDIKFSNFVTACSLVIVIQNLGTTKDWFFETIRVYDQDIKLPGKDSENIPLASITSISRDERNITLDFKNQSSFSSIIEEGSIRNYDKLIELWRGHQNMNI